MIKWKCVLCDAKCETEVKPGLGQRLCNKCLLRHYQTLVQIYKPERGVILDEAKRLLEQAKKEVKA